MAANLSFDKQTPPLDVEAVRRDFPILATKVHGHPLVYLDSAASSQRALPVLRAVEEYETHSHANVHRGVHALSQAATSAFEGARERVRRFINAASVKEIIFVRGTTEGINLVAQAYARPRFRAGDEILITGLEHHANIVPWQMVCEQTGASLRVAPLNRRGEVPFDEFERRLGPRTRLDAASLSQWIAAVEVEARRSGSGWTPPGLSLADLDLDFPVELDALGTIFTNLLRNAVAAVAGRPDARVIIRADRERDVTGRQWVTLLVGDSAEASLTLESIEARESGRGLAIVRDLVRAWRGHLLVRPEAAPLSKLVGASFPL